MRLIGQYSMVTTPELQLHAVLPTKQKKVIFCATNQLLAVGYRSIFWIEAMFIYPWVHALSTLILGVYSTGVVS